MSISRRSFLKAGILLPTLASSLPAALSSFQNDDSFDPWIEIHAAHLHHNIEQISQRTHGKPILAVIKNNGYGLGVLNVARILEPLPAVAGFAVVKFQEAMVLRDGGIKKPILLLGPFSEREFDEAVTRDVMLMAYTPIVSMIERASAKLRKRIPIHICIDTGIGRVGVPYDRAEPLIQEFARSSAVTIEGVMMTFTEDPEFDHEQFRRFQSLCARLEQKGMKLGKRHAVSSFGLFQHPDKFLDMVRPGMAIYGIYPEKEFRGTAMDLRPAVSLKTRVAYVKQLRKGESAGYNRAYVAPSDVWVATLPVGHADGLPRVAVKGAKVRIGGLLYPVVAISASHTIVDLGTETSVRIGDVATIFDWQEGSRPEDFAYACGASVYDLTMHLNPLLPRRIV
ncbi:MAG TPA: alanine racemase [Bacteroidota bacterium]|nr:alanine racemase [Bacteroidota bacterium]